MRVIASVGGKLQRALLAIFKRYIRCSALCWLIVTSSFNIAMADINAKVKGVDAPLAENITTFIDAIDHLESLSTPLLNRRLKQAVGKATRAMGYYHAEFSLERHSDELIVNVVAGVRTHIVSPELIIQGAAKDMAVFKEAIARSKLQQGDPLNHEHFDAYKLKIQSLAQQFGFLDGQFVTTQLRVNREKNTAQPVLIFNSGQRYRFASVTFVGTALDPSLLHELNPVVVGSLVESDALALLKRKLVSTNYFTQVEIQRHKDTKTKRLAITVALSDDDNSHYQLGVGYSTDYGARFRMGWQRRLLNPAGHSAKLQSQITSAKQELEAEYRIPWTEPLKQYTKLSSGYELKDYEDGYSRLFNLSAGYVEKRISRWVFSQDINYEWEKYSEDDTDQTVTSYLLPEISATYVTIDKGFDPSHGRRFESTLEGSNRQLGADTNFVKAYIAVRQLWPLLSDKTLLLLRLELGAIATNDLERVPLSKRFFTGGDNSIRGYRYESVAPEDSNGDKVGGQYLNTFSAEVSHKILPKWRIATFADTGRAYTNSNESFSSSVGVGVRWLSRAGQIRLDLAHALDDPTTSFLVHISMGPPL